MDINEALQAVQAAQKIYAWAKDIDDVLVHATQAVAARDAAVEAARQAEAKCQELKEINTRLDSSVIKMTIRENALSKDIEALEETYNTKTAALNAVFVEKSVALQAEYDAQLAHFAKELELYRIQCAEEKNRIDAEIAVLLKEKLAIEKDILDLKTKWG